MKLKHSILSILNKRERETPEYLFLAQKLYADIKDKYIRKEVAPYIARFLEHPCDRTSNELIQFWIRWRSTTISKQGPEQFIQAIEASFGRTLTERERTILFHVKVRAPHIMWTPEAQPSEDISQFQEQVIRALVEKIAKLPGDNHVPEESYELEAVRLGLHALTRGGDYPLLYLLVGQAVARKLGIT
jgi:hypothetical protein